MTFTPVNVGLVGCGVISGIYLEAGRRFESIRIAACADLMRERAEARAAEYDLPRVLEVDELLRDAEIEIVLNLTIPRAHADIALAALEAGKSVYNEKPLAIEREDGQRMLALAERQGLRIGCAPDKIGRA